MLARHASGAMQANSQQQRPQGQSQQTQEQRQQVLRQQQQRLLLLRHASKCPHGETNVTVTQENHSEGARVKRGPNWKWGDQDGGSANRHSWEEAVQPVDHRDVGKHTTGA